MARSSSLSISPVPGVDPHTEALCHPGVTFQELTLDGINDQDCASEVTAVYDLATPGLQYAGPVVRHSGTGATATFFMAKLQDNGAPNTGWDRFYVYYYNGASFQSAGIASQAIAVPITAARCRLQAVNEGTVVRLSLFIDTDLDGLWNITSEATTTLGLATSGRPGICGYRNAKADDFKYFAGTLRMTALPTNGTSVPFAGTGAANQIYYCASSAGHAGFPITATQWVPLDVDWLFSLSLQLPAVFVAFSGFTAADGTFGMIINLPADPGLAGFTFWTSGVTFDGAAFPEVFPDVQTTIL